MKELLAKIIEAISKVFEEYLSKKDKERETPDADYTGKAKIGLIVGHTKRSPGASFNNGAFSAEYDFNSEVAKQAKLYCKTKYGNVLDTEIIFRDRIGIPGAYRKAEKIGCDVVIELHFNAFNKTVEGTETLTTSHVGDREFALEIQKMMCRIFKRKGLSRGVKPIAKSARAGENVYAFPKGYNCLVEPFFGDNEKEAIFADVVLGDYSRGLIDSCFDFCKNYLGLIK